MRRAAALLLTLTATLALGACGGGAGDSAKSSPFCESAKRGEFANATAGINPFAPPAELKAGVEATEKKFRDGKGTAPDELKDEFTALEGVFARAKAELNKGGYDINKVDQAALRAAFADAEAPGRSIAEYSKKVCGVEVTLPTAPATSTP